MATAEKGDMTTAEALRHPIRVRALEVLNERDTSPTRFANEGHAGDPDDPNVLSSVSYHFRQLAKAGAIVPVGERKVRGATEVTFRGAARAYFSDEEWAKIPKKQREQISRVMYQGLFARVEGAMLKGTFDARDDRWLVWRWMRLDEQGWSELTAALHRADAEVAAIQRESEARLKETEGKQISATYGLLGFESPEA